MSARIAPQDAGSDPRRVLVTGASAGIGAASALALARPGAELWLTYAADRAGAEGTAAACAAAGARARVAQLDLRDPAAIAHLAGEVATEWGELHALVNNGGMSPPRTWPGIPVAEWDEVMEVNARGTFLL